MAAVVNLFVDQGSDYTLTLTVKDDSGNATDITGFTVEAYFQKWTGATQVYKFTPTVTDATAGKVQIALKGSVSDDIPSGRYSYDVVINHASNDITRRVNGKLEVKVGDNHVSLNEYFDMAKIIDGKKYANKSDNVATNSACNAA